MKKLVMSGVIVAGCLIGLANVALADKVEVEKKARETRVTLSIKEMPVDKAIDLISMMSGIMIKKTGMPKDIPVVTTELKDIPALEAIRFVTALAGLTYTVGDDGIDVSGGGKQAPNIR